MLGTKKPISIISFEDEYKEKLASRVVAVGAAIFMTFLFGYEKSI